MPTTYVPKCFARKRSGNYGEFISISFDAKELIAFVQQNTNAKGYFNVTVSERREPSDKGLTHSVALDTFEPGQRREGGAAPAPAPRPARPQPSAPPHDGPAVGDDVPF